MLDESPDYNNKKMVHKKDEAFEIVMDIEGVECKMSDIDENEVSDDVNSNTQGFRAAEAFVEGRNVRASIMQSPKNSHHVNHHRLSEASLLSSVNYGYQSMLMNSGKFNRSG